MRGEKVIWKQNVKEIAVLGVRDISADNVLCLWQEVHIPGMPKTSLGSLNPQLLNCAWTVFCLILNRSLLNVETLTFFKIFKNEGHMTDATTKRVLHLKTRKRNRLFTKRGVGGRGSILLPDPWVGEWGHTCHKCTLLFSIAIYKCQKCAISVFCDVSVHNIYSWAIDGSAITGPQDHMDNYSAHRASAQVTGHYWILGWDVYTWTCWKSAEWKTFCTMLASCFMSTHINWIQTDSYRIHACAQYE